jgi:hypothetical protein
MDYSYDLDFLSHKLAGIFGMELFGEMFSQAESENV